MNEHDDTPVETLAELSVNIDWLGRILDGLKTGALIAIAIVLAVR